MLIPWTYHLSTLLYPVNKRYPTATMINALQLSPQKIIDLQANISQQKPKIQKQQQTCQLTI